MILTAMVTLIIFLFLSVPIACVVRVVLEHERYQRHTWETRAAQAPQFTPREVAHLRFIRWLRHNSSGETFEDDREGSRTQKARGRSDTPAA